MMHTTQRLIDYHDLRGALAALCGGLPDGDVLPAQATSVDEAAMPEPFRSLLVHHDHMTTRLGDHHGRPVELRVLDHERSDHLYRRRIVLTLAGTDDVVEYGIVRLDLAFVDDAVRDEILDRVVPLGDILIRRNVLRRIEPRWYLKAGPDTAPTCEGRRLWASDVYGRVGTIYCDERPAIELLEVVMPPGGDEGSTT